jgi:hypothetical protein
MPLFSLSCLYYSLKHSSHKIIPLVPLWKNSLLHFTQICLCSFFIELLIFYLVSILNCLECEHLIEQYLE